MIKSFLGDENMLLKKAKGMFMMFKENVQTKRLKKKIEDELYMKYIKEAIREAEEDIANGGKTYTLEEYRELMRERYGADI